MRTTHHRAASDKSGPTRFHRAAMLALGLACLLVGPSVAHAQGTPSGGATSVAEPTSPRVGKVRRNAQGVIELVPDAAPATPLAPSSAPQPVESIPAPLPVKQLPAPSAPLVRLGGGAASAQKQPAETPEPARASATAMPACDTAVLLCLRVTATADEEQKQVPLTFGHPLAQGLLQPGEAVVARLGDAILPVQIDQIARHRDGSVRFAVFSVSLPRVGAREVATLEIVKGGPAATVQIPPIPSVAADLKLELDTYAAQISEVTFGNRSGGTPGIPFKRGETITLAIGPDPAETYTLSITPELEGGLHPTLTKIAAAFVPLMSKSATYRAHRDAPEVYETLWITSREAPGKPFPVRVIYGGAAKVAVKEVQKWEPRRRYVAALAADGAPAGAPWLDGPVARESYASVPLRAEADGREHPALGVLVGVRRYAGQDRARYDVAVDNTSILVDAMRNYSYDATVRIGGAVRFEKKNIEHFIAARWHKPLWAGKAPQVELIHDRARMLDSRALPAYDADLRVSEAIVADQYASLLRADTGPMGAAFIYPRMPTTGGRPDIGPLPRWSALHVLTQDPRQMRVVLANGDASGSVPVHYRDPRADMPVNVKQYPAGRLYGGVFNLGQKTVPYGWALSPFIPDTSHEPSLAYYPYLLTGERFYLDELHYWASYNAFVQSQGGRGGGAGLLHADQVRGQAWTLRELARAALITPDKHPMKDVFREQLKANVDSYVKRFASGEPDGGGVLRVITDPYHHDDMSPWQQDFMAIVVANLVENNVDGADRLVRWMSGYVVGRWLAEDKGYCRANGIGYWLKTNDPSTGKRVTTWADFHRANWPQQKSCAGLPWSDELADCASCYTGIARAALASLVNIGIAEAREPYDFIRLQTPNSRAKFASDPTFALAPRRQ